jgi:hypothetical protein
MKKAGIDNFFQRGIVSTVRMSVSKTEGLGSNPSAPAKYVMNDQYLEKFFFEKAKELNSKGALFSETTKYLQAMKSHAPKTYYHQMRVALVAERMASLAGHSDTKPEFFGGANHDVGKLKISSTYLNEGKISLEDYEEIKKHAGNAKEELKEFLFVSCIASAHHSLQKNSYGFTLEQCLNGIKISQEAKSRLNEALIHVSIADFFDACNSRPAGLMWEDQEKDCSIIGSVYSEYPEKIKILEADNFFKILYGFNG